MRCTRLTSPWHSCRAEHRPSQRSRTSRGRSTAGMSVVWTVSAASVFGSWFIDFACRSPAVSALGVSQEAEIRDLCSARTCPCPLPCIHLAVALVSRERNTANILARHLRPRNPPTVALSQVFLRGRRIDHHQSFLAVHQLLGQFSYCRSFLSVVFSIMIIRFQLGGFKCRTSEQK